MQEGIATANLILAQLNLKQEKLDAALANINLCLQITKSSGIIELEQRAYLVRSQIYFEAQRFV